MSDENINIKKMKEIYILSKEVNKNIINIIKVKQLKDKNKHNQKLKGEKNNKKYSKKEISVIKYNINNEEEIKIFGKLFVKNNRKKTK